MFELPPDVGPSGTSTVCPPVTVLFTLTLVFAFEVAEELSFEHQSVGEGDGRFITVFFVPKSNQDEEEAAVAEAKPDAVDAVPCAPDEWWRVKVFYDRYRPDFALVRGLLYIAVSSDTRIERDSKVRVRVRVR